MYRQWIILTIVLVSAQDSSGSIGNACYGTNIACDFYSLQCPQGEIIHLNNLIAGGKTNQTCRSEQHCSGGLDCCSYSQGDITSSFNLENTYHTYRNCSGRQSCAAIQAPWQRLDGQTFSSYVQIEYNCERASTKIPMCGSNPSIYNSSAEVWFDGSTETFDPTKASKECRCTIKNNQIGRGLELYMYLLDVRLESHYVGNVSSAACSSAQFSSEMIVIQCANTTQHWVTNFKYYDANSLTHQYSKVLQSGQTTDIGLASLYKDGQRDAPAMVWIRIASAPTTTSTSEPTTVIPVTPMPSATTRRTTNAPRTTSGSAPLVKDSDDNDTKTKIYLAILVPIAAAIAFGVIFCMWLYWKRNNKRPLKLLHQKKQRTKSEIYRVFSNPKGDNVLEDIIKREHGLRTPSLHESKPASVFGPDQPSFSHYVSGVPDPYEDAFVIGPSHAHDNPLYEDVDDKKSPLDGNGPYVIPLNVTEENPDKLPEPQSNGIRPRTTYIKLKHARPSTKSNVPATSDLTDSTKDIADVYEPGETKGDLQNSANKIPGTPRPIVNTNPDGSVTVHIDNVSNPSVPNSARSTPGASSPVSSRTRSPERGGFMPRCDK
ncbi:hypothetical protein MAR_018428 [Mya arenaria]|uniref:Uncharacterized protein n=1 Tax=Mya arenaria TaxID=6604 RepID=A0ABY7EH75_MYAAR|nr:hypothetical protein MAR_018428 [Mya arenaria]